MATRGLDRLLARARFRSEDEVGIRGRRESEMLTTDKTMDFTVVRHGDALGGSAARNPPYVHR